MSSYDDFVAATKVAFTKDVWDTCASYLASAVDQYMQDWEGGGGVIQLSINPGVTYEADTIQLTNSHACKWSISGIFGTKYNVQEVMGLEQNGVAKYTKYAFLGDTINYVISVSTDGSNLKLLIRNNESSALTVRFRRYVT